MTEKEYIRVTEITRVRAINEIIRNIIPENSDVITREEYNKVVHYLYKWEDGLSKKVNKSAG